MEQRSLFERLGGSEAIAAVVDDFVARCAGDSRINGKFAHIDWTPIRYVNQGYPRAGLAGLYRAADIALVTPLRDGMNLVAKEYVAAQDPDNPGVLILSKFAGAAERMTEALLVNPYSRDDLSDIILRALQMPLEERRARWQALLESVRTDDVHRWWRRFVDALRPNTPQQVDLILDQAR